MTAEAGSDGSRGIEPRLVALEKRLDAVVELLRQVLALLTRVAGKP